MTISHDGGPAAPTAASPLLEIANAMVHLYKVALGRGPTHARARFAGADLLVVVLQDTMTVSERRLAGMGQHDDHGGRRLQRQGRRNQGGRRTPGAVHGATAALLDIAWSSFV